MKKLYTLLMAMAVVFSASALSFGNHAGKKLNAPSKSAISMKKKAKAPSRAAEAPTLEEIEGTWEWSAYDMKEDELTSFDINIVVADETQNSILIENFCEDGIDVYATYDPDNCTITIPYSVIWPDSDEGLDLAFATFAYTLDEEDYLDELYPDKALSLTLAYDEEEGYFYNWDDIYGIVAAIDGEPVTDDWYMWIVLLNMAQINPVTIVADIVDNDDDFEDAGLAILVDGWLYPAYGIDHTEFPLTVAVQKSKTEEGIYRLVDPYSADGEHIAGAIDNISEEPGYIRINLVDTRVPYIYPNVFSGFEHESLGRMYFYDYTGYLVECQGEPANYHYLTVQHNAKLLSSYDEETGTMTIPRSLFGYGANHKNDAERWYGDSNEPLDFTTTIKFLGNTSAVGNVSTENSPVEFYNLQGMRVGSNARGILILRNGNTTRKVTR